MTVPPPTCPWPPPRLPAAALQPPAPAPAAPSASHRGVPALVAAARRLASPTERAQRAAAKEELRLTADLDDLPVGWFVFHAADLGHGPCDLGAIDAIDHLVIGPGGMFAIVVDHQRDARIWVSEHKLTINGRDSALLGSTRSITRRMSGALSAACGFDVTVQAVLVLVGAAAMQTLSRPAEVHVRTQHDLRDWLCKQPVRLGEPTIAAIADQVQAPSHAAALLVE